MPRMPCAPSVSTSGACNTRRSLTLLAMRQRSQKESEAGGERVAAMHRRDVAGLTPRALLIGTLLIPLMCLWVEYSEIVSQATDASGFSLLFPAVFVLFVLVLLNQALRRFVP